MDVGRAMKNCALNFADFVERRLCILMQNTTISHQQLLKAKSGGWTNTVGSQASDTNVAPAFTEAIVQLAEACAKISFQL